MIERVRFQGDVNFNKLIIRGLLRRQPLIDFQTGEAAQLHGVNDADVLALIAPTGRILVSHDYHTMPDHFADFLARGEPTPGIILLHQTLLIAQAIEALLLVWEASTPNEWRDTLTYLPWVA